MSSTLETKPGSPKYWQSLEEWRGDPSFRQLAEQEFMSSPLREGDELSASEGGWARREFLKLMGASIALTSFGCIRRPMQKIVPYVQRPKDMVEGIANYYASSFCDGGETLGVVITTREGRPVHVTGNADNPINRGGMSARAHAHVLSLYDPGRLNGPVKNLLNETKSNRDTISFAYDKADAEIAKQLKKGGVAILTSSVVSPSLNKVMSEFASASGAHVYVWDPLPHDHYVQAQAMCYGSEVAPRLVLDKAKVIVAINNDFLGTWLQPVQQTHGFGLGRKPGTDMSKLVVFESLLTLTGTNADSRYRIRSSDAVAVAMGLLYELLVKQKASSYANDGAITNIVKDYMDAESTLGLPAGTLAKVADELWQNRGHSLVLGGRDLASQVAANLLNSVLGNDGTTIDARKSYNTGFQGSYKNLATLVSGLNDGKIKTVIINGVNAVYATPEKLGLQAALNKAEMAIYTGDRNDETGKYCDYVLPDNHPMEGWGDVEGQKGVYSIQQPTIQSLHDTRGFGDTLIAFAKAAGIGGPSKYDSFYSVVKAQAESHGAKDWIQFLQEGVATTVNRETSDSGRSFKAAGLQAAKKKGAMPKAELELVLYPTVGLRDGQMANVPWLQEFPDPVSKICWDNYLSVSPTKAAEYSLREGQIVELDAGGKTVKVPVHIQPGQHDAVLGLALGYGRTDVGDVGNNVGVNAYQLANYEDGNATFSGLTATFKPTKVFSPMATTQEHHRMEGRQIVVEATLEQFKNNPEANIQRHPTFSAWSSFKYEGHKWGMAIDLTQCTGCGSCVIACQSENNIPIVGKQYVLKGREMHWIRIDRYYVGDENNPDTVHMPVTCQHCDNAPCETVCPVAATVHSAEGTNDMIYNRCVGTRYCSNNCPYKVRRFNWFNYARMHPELYQSPMHMQLNPEVTVRDRGVMEKCTFCTQRIKAGKMRAKLEDRKLQDGEIVTACQSSCPTNAIVFGDLNDPESQVSKILNDKRYYPLLEELNTRPAVKYASKIRNCDQLKGEHAHIELEELEEDGHRSHKRHGEHERGGHA